MAGYTNEYSTFPERVDDFVKRRDVGIGEVGDRPYTNQNIITWINEINSLRASGDYRNAASKIAEHAEAIEPYNLSLDSINRILEGIRNTQIKTQVAGQGLSVDEGEPLAPTAGFVWLGGN